MKNTIECRQGKWEGYQDVSVEKKSIPWNTKEGRRQVRRTGEEAIRLTEKVKEREEVMKDKGEINEMEKKKVNDF
jgi:hypothetical protein